MLGRILRVIINSFTFVLLLVIAYITMRTNPLLSLILLLSAIDQFEDVYYYVYGKRLFPEWFMPFDIVFECVVIGIGIGVLLFSLVYYVYFETWFFKALMFLSIIMIYSAVEDIIMWRSTPVSGGEQIRAPRRFVQHVCSKEKSVCKEERFV